jgi:hypothetical protein
MTLFFQKLKLPALINSLIIFSILLTSAYTFAGTGSIGGGANQSWSAILSNWDLSPQVPKIKYHIKEYGRSINVPITNLCIDKENYFNSIEKVKFYENPWADDHTALAWKTKKVHVEFKNEYIDKKCDRRNCDTIIKKHPLDYRISVYENSQSENDSQMYTGPLFRKNYRILNCGDIL